MTKLWKIISDTLLIVLGTFVILVLLPLIVCLLLFLLVSSLYEKLWSFVRRDPKNILPLSGVYDFDNRAYELDYSYEDYDVFLNEFSLTCEFIANESHAKMSQLKKIGFSNAENNQEPIDHKLERRLSTSKASIIITSEFYSTKNEDGDWVYMTEDTNTGEAGALPSVNVQVANESDDINFDFNLSEMGLWVAIAVLRGDAKFIYLQRSKSLTQIWAHMPEYHLWVVRYDLKNYSYGFRKKFKQNYAQRFFFDTKYPKKIVTPKFV